MCVCVCFYVLRMLYCVSACVLCVCEKVCALFVCKCVVNVQYVFETLCGNVIDVSVSVCV